MKKTKVYKLVINNDEEFQKVLGLGFIADSPCLLKETKIKFEDPAAQAVIEMLNNSSWQKSFLNRKTKKLFKKSGIYFTRDKVVVNDLVKDIATTWVLVADMSDDGEIGVTCNCSFYPFQFYKSSIINKYFKKEITKLKELGLVETIEKEDDTEENN